MILFDLICSNVHVANFENFSQNRSLINFSLILTVHYTRYNIVLMDSIQSKTHVVQGYEYREYRGPGLPSSLSGMTLKPTIGDLYISPVLTRSGSMQEGPKVGSNGDQ
jgi:hypothetical protein